jgi:hypothetical protein
VLIRENGENIPIWTRMKFFQEENITLK